MWAIHLYVGSHAAEETDEAGGSGVSEIAVRVKNVLHGFQEGVVVEWGEGDGAGFEKWGEQYGARAISTVALETQADGGSDIGGLREGGQV